MPSVFVLISTVLSFLLASGQGIAAELIQTVRLADAVEAAIVNATGVLLQEQTVVRKKGIIQEEEGSFDPQLTWFNSLRQSDTPFNSYSRNYYAKDSEKTRTLSSSLSVKKTLPTGLSFGPSLSLGRTRDNLNYSTDNTAVMKFTITVPLLKGWGRSSTGAALQAASIDLEAAGLDLVQSAAESARKVTKSFWAALTAEMELHIYEETERDSRVLLENARMLVEKNEMPAIQLDTLTADVDVRTAERLNQEQILAAAKYKLAVDMGGEAPALVDTFQVDGSFPPVDMNVASVQELLKFAQDNRQDLQAERRLEKYYAVLVTKFKNEMLPDVSLQGSVGYQGLSEEDSASGYLESVSSDTSGVNYAIALNLTYSFGNNFAQGKLMQYQAMEKMQNINVTSTMRSINADILAQHSGFLSIAKQITHQRNAVERYRAALEKKRTGLLHGMITLTDLLDIRDTYRDSKLTLVSMKNLYADALIDLRLACGYLIVKEGNLVQVDPKFLVTPPRTPLPVTSGEEKKDQKTPRN